MKQRLRNRIAKGLTVTAIFSALYVGYAHVAAAVWGRYTPDSWSYNGAFDAPNLQLEIVEDKLRVDRSSDGLYVSGATGNVIVRHRAVRLERGLAHARVQLTPNSKVLLRFVSIQHPSRSIGLSLHLEGSELFWQVEGQLTEKGVDVGGSPLLQHGVIAELTRSQRSGLAFSLRYNPLIRTFEFGVGDTPVGVISSDWTAGTQVRLELLVESNGAAAPTALQQLSWSSEVDRPLRGNDHDERFVSTLFPPVGWTLSATDAGQINGQPIAMDILGVSRDPAGGARFFSDNAVGSRSICSMPFTLVPVTLGMTWQRIAGSAGLEYFVDLRNLAGNRFISAQFRLQEGGTPTARLVGHRGDDLAPTPMKEAGWTAGQVSTVGLKYNPWVRRAQLTDGEGTVTDSTFALRKDELVTACFGMTSLDPKQKIEQRLEHIYLHLGPY